jgi:hypothetical protein
VKKNKELNTNITPLNHSNNNKSSIDPLFLPVIAGVDKEVFYLFNGEDN